MHDKYTIQQILQFRYLGMFLINGFWKIISNVKYEICFFACICLYFFVGTNLISSYTGPLAKMCAAISGIALLVVGVLLLLVSVWRIGAPKGYIGIMQNMYRVGLVNSAGEAPVLLDRRKSDKKPRTEIWEFESYGVPFSAWLDYAEKLESALDVAVIQTAPGRDGRKVLLTVIPHPGPWPEILPWNNKYLPKNDSVLVLGENRCEQVTLDLSGIPHILTAGRTGSGKSVLQKSLMLQCLAHGMQVVLVDYKMGVDYSREWPKYCQIITDDDAMLNRLKELQKEMLSRYQLFTDKGYSNIDEYNSAGGSMRRICLFIDEIAECLDRTNAADKEQKKTINVISEAISGLCRLGRAAGIHVFLSTQRGSADVLSGQIRSNVFKILGAADDNLSILTLGNAEAARKIPADARGRFIDERGNMFQGYYSDYGPDVFAPLEGM